MGRLVLLGWSVVLLVGCESSPPPPIVDVTQPYGGATRRFVVDRFVLGTASVNVDADDLNGDGNLDNQGQVAIDVLSDGGDLTTHAADMIASGRIASSLVLAFPDTDVIDVHAGAFYFGGDSDTPVPCGGLLELERAVGTGIDVTFASNRTRTTHVPGRANVVLPAIADADPLTLEIDGLEIDLEGDGSGGFDGVLRGGVPHQAALDSVAGALLQMMVTQPLAHREAIEEFDGPTHDGVVTVEDIENVGPVKTFLGADIQLFQDGTFAPAPVSTQPDSVSIAIRVHLAPCDAGTCVTAPPVDTCHDRTVDGGESDVDCGGRSACGPCVSGLRCTQASDCASNACDAGVCRVATCSDGVRDGFESDIDCGYGCQACVAGKACLSKLDCASGQCNLKGASMQPGGFFLGVCL